MRNEVVEGARVSELATESEVFVVVVVLETAEPEDAELADLKSVGGRRETRGEEAVVVSLGGHFCEEEIANQRLRFESAKGLEGGEEGSGRWRTNRVG